MKSSLIKFLLLIEHFIHKTNTFETESKIAKRSKIFTLAPFPLKTTFYAQNAEIGSLSKTFKQEQGRLLQQKDSSSNNKDKIVHEFEASGLRRSDDSYVQDSQKTALNDTANKLEENILYEANDQKAVFILSEDNKNQTSFVIEAVGLGKLQIEVFSGTGENATQTIDLEIDQFPLYIILDGADYLQNKGSGFTIQNTEAGNKNLTWAFKVSKKSFIELSFDTKVSVNSLFLRSFQFKVRMPLHWNDPSTDNRFQFVLHSNLDEIALTGNETLGMFINKGEIFPTRDKYDAAPKGILNGGMIKTLSSGNPIYCNKDDCVYAVTIYSEKIDFYTFHPCIFKNGAVLKLSEQMLLIEELEPAEEVRYELILPEKTGAWIFSMTPTENEIELLLNPDIEPENTINYSYIASSKSPQEIIITHSEALHFNYTFTKFFVRYKAVDPLKTCTFKFSVKHSPVEQGIPLKPETLETGSLFPQEIVNYYLDLSGETLVLASLALRLGSFEGKSSVYVKECLSENPIDCFVSAKDISALKNKEELKKLQSERLFFFSKEETNEDHKYTVLDQVKLKINCLNGESKSLVNNTHPVSEKCLFSVGVYNDEAFMGDGVYYELAMRKESSHIELKNKETLSMQIAAEEEGNFVLNIPAEILKENSTALVQVIAISGSASFYFSQSNPFPGPNDNDAFLDFKEEDFSSIHTTILNKTLSLQSSNLTGNGSGLVYVSIQGHDFSVFDFSVSILTQSEEESKAEIIEMNHLYTRSIEEDSFVVKNNTRIYFRAFEVPVNLTVDGIEVLEKIGLTINSAIPGLKLCVQIKGNSFDATKMCDYESSSNYLQLSTQNFVSDSEIKIFIGVEKVFPKDKNFNRFPIEFSLALNTNGQFNQFELVQPGRTFIGHVDPFSALTIWLDLSKMKNSAVIFFESDDPLSRIDLYGGSMSDSNSSETLTILDPYKFGLFIPSASKYKLKFCPDNKCQMRGLVYTMGDKQAHFALTYTIDDQPVVIQEGYQLTVPNSIPLYFVYAFEQTVDLNFNYISDGTSSVALSKLISQNSITKGADLASFINEVLFDFKTDIDRALQIIYPPMMLQKEKDSIALFLVEPKFNARVINKDALTFEFEGVDKAVVYVQSEVLLLKPFLNVKQQLKKGEFRYFKIDQLEPREFSVMLSVIGGEALLFLGKGENEFPTLKRYWQKGTSLHGDVLEIRKSSVRMASELAEKFIVGVYGVANASFDILFLPDFANLIKVKFQNIVDMRLDEGKYYYFDFFDTKQDFRSLFYVENSDVEVSILDFDKRKGQDMASMLASEINYEQKFTLYKGAPPRTYISDDKSLVGKHLILRLKATQGHANINLLMFDEKQPIMAPANHRFHFELEKNSEVLFQVALDHSFEDVDIDTKLTFGHIEIAASEDLSNFDSFVKLEQPTQRSFTFSLSKKDESSDIIVFKKLYLKVKAAELSRFSVSVYPRNMFKEIKALQPEILYSSPDQESFLYFELRPEDMKEVHSLEFDVNTVSFFGEKPDLLFLPFAGDLPSPDSKFIPMPLKDIVERNSGEYRQLLIRPELREGSFILKLPKNPNHLPIKVNAIVNHEKSIESNGLYKGTVPKTSADSGLYSMFINEPGEFRLVIESCNRVDIKDAQFKTNKESNPVNFGAALAQGYPYIFVDEQAIGGPRREFRMITYPIRRGLVASEGTLTFTVALPNEKTESVPQPKSDFSAKNTDEFFVLMSEFRPNNKELILKDYIEIMPTDAKGSAEVFGYEFYDSYRKLKIFARTPLFKPQLLLDYPDIKKVLLKFNFYLFSDKDVERKMASCGLSLTEVTENVPFKVLQTLDRKDLESSHNSSSLVEAHFFESSLELFKDSANLNILCYVSVNFFENEDDEWQVSLNLKFTNVPYFLMNIPNKYLNNYLVVILLTLCFGLIFCLAIYAVFRYFKKPYDVIMGDVRLKDDISYIPPSMQSEILRFSVEI